MAIQANREDELINIIELMIDESLQEEFFYYGSVGNSKKIYSKSNCFFGGYKKLPEEKQKELEQRYINAGWKSLTYKYDDYSKDYYFVLEK